MTNDKPAKHIIVAITGASGAAYALRLIQTLVNNHATVHLIVSPYGQRLFNDELDIGRIDAKSLGVNDSMRLCVYRHNDVGATLASGSFFTDGMIICPCSTNTMGAIAAGLGDNLITRAASVTLKEKRRLVLVPREMPLSHIDLLNAVKLSGAGAVICPPAPGFYMLPKTLEEVVDFVAGKLCDLVGVSHELNTRWEKQAKQLSTDLNNDANTTQRSESG